MSGRAAPPKPWERRGGATGSTTTPLGPSTAGDGAPKPWEQPQGAVASTSGALSRDPPSRPWERAGTTYSSPAGTAYSNSYSANSGQYGGAGSYGGGGYGTGGSMYGSGYGAGSAYGSGYGAGSSIYGRPAYGVGGLGGVGGYNSYGAGASYGAGGMYGSRCGGGLYGGSGMYGGGGYGGGLGGMYGSPMGAPYGAIGGPMGPNGPFDPNDPNAPPQPPSAWQAMLRGISGIVHFFGRLSFLVDENAHAVHFFISALLQLLDRAGSLYGELARFVLRMLGYKPKPKEMAAQSAKAADSTSAQGPDFLGSFSAPLHEHRQPAPLQLVSWPAGQ
ncbi:hypothetical protein WJX72_002940 [[Myrmecia] bisecta]|uniref:Peroxin-13 n=1 Tax=[Myrmecia] bisecta TaxID=41462 RepID=A0AAW1QQJ4_9CHLO